MSDCWKCKFMICCRGRSFGCLTEYLCTKPYTAISLTKDMIDLIDTVGCKSFEVKQ